MPRYSYKAIDQKGVRIEGELAAATREGALETLVRRGQYPIELAEGGTKPEVKWWQREVFGSGRLSLATLAMFTSELTSLVKADLPIDECLRLVAIQPMIPQKLRQTVGNILAGVVEGSSLSDALAGEGPAFPEFYWRLVRAGEASGSLGACLEDLSSFVERSAETRSKIFSALLYPAVLIVAALAATFVIMMVLLPAIMPIFKDAGAELPILIRVLGDSRKRSERTGRSCWSHWPASQRLSQQQCKIRASGRSWIGSFCAVPLSGVSLSNGNQGA